MNEWNDKLFVIAGNRTEYLEYIRSHRQYIISSSLDPYNCIFVSNPWVLRGVRIKYYAFYGRYDLRSDISEIRELLYLSLLHDAIDLSTVEKNITKAEKNVIDMGKNFHNLWKNVFDFLQD